MEENVSKYTNAIGSGKQAITQGQKRKGGRGMREGWEYICFESCLNKIPKAKQVTTKEYNSGTKYPIISQEDKLISGYCDDESMLFHVDKPVIIFGDHTRVLKYIDFDFVVGADGVKIISPKENLNTKFLLYFLTWYNIPNLGYSRHYKLLKELDIPVPPLSTQLSIVSELDKINELIRLKKEQLKDYDNLAQSIFYEMFGDPVVNEKGWEVKKLGELCVSKLKYGSGASAVDFDGNIRYVRITDINEDGTLNNDIKSPNIVDDEYLLNVGDIVFARSGATVGKTYLHRKNNIKCLYAGYLIKATLNTKMALPIYVFQFTQSKYYKDWVNLNARAVAQPNINAKQYGDLQIPLPPLTLQQVFAQRIELIEQQKDEIKSTISDLETLLASRMQYWFD